MSDLDLQQVLGARYRTSQEADGYTNDLQRRLGLSTRAAVARIAIGRSLGMGPLLDTSVDSKGLDIPATVFFSSEDVGAWVGLIVSHAFTFGQTLINTSDGLRNAIRLHWHRGALALWSDWKDCRENYDKFIETLITRHSEMPEHGTGNDSDGATGLGEKPHSDAEVPKDEAQTLTRALGELGIKVQVKDAMHGPRLTRYRALLHNLNDAVKVRRNADQLGLALNLGGARVSVSNGDEAKTLFIDVPRTRSSWRTVGIDRLRDWASSTHKEPSQLLVYAGVDVVGSDVSFDLTAAPHILIGGTTNSGKSVCLHSLLLSLLLRNKPENLQIALIDPKQVELAAYSKIPHLYGGEIVTDMSRAAALLEELVIEMDARYSIFQQIGVVNIGEARRKGRDIPFIVVAVEELADLVMEHEDAQLHLVRLAQKARAAGIHLVLATQRPDSDTFSGLLRTNIPCRIALTVRVDAESRIILGENGAEKLLGLGDMLVRLPGDTSARRAHGVFVRPEELKLSLGSLGR